MTKHRLEDNLIIWGSYTLLLACILASLFGCGPSSKKSVKIHGPPNPPAARIEWQAPVGAATRLQRLRLSKIVEDSEIFVEAYTKVQLRPDVVFRWVDTNTHCAPFAGCAHPGPYYRGGWVWLQTSHAEYAAHELLHIAFFQNPRMGYPNGDPNHTSYRWGPVYTQGVAIAARYP